MDILDRNSVKIHWLLIKNPILRMWKIRSFIRQGNYNAVISFRYARLLELYISYWRTYLESNNE